MHRLLQPPFLFLCLLAFSEGALAKPMSKKEYLRFEGVYQVRSKGFIREQSTVTPVDETRRQRVKLRGSSSSRVEIPGGHYEKFDPDRIFIGRRVIRIKGQFIGYVITSETVPRSIVPGQIFTGHEVYGSYKTFMRRLGKGGRTRFQIKNVDRIIIGTYGEINLVKDGWKR
ncbi:MAG: hypothetical protein AAGC68_11320 [Verrucomicrobiota bacterium]